MSTLRYLWIQTDQCLEVKESAREREGEGGLMNLEGSGKEEGRSG